MRDHIADAPQPTKDVRGFGAIPDRWHEEAKALVARCCPHASEAGRERAVLRLVKVLSETWRAYRE